MTSTEKEQLEFRKNALLGAVKKAWAVCEARWDGTSLHVWMAVNPDVHYEYPPTFAPHTSKSVILVVYVCADCQQVDFGEIAPQILRTSFHESEFTEKGESRFAELAEKRLGDACAAAYDKLLESRSRSR